MKRLKNADICVELKKKKNPMSTEELRAPAYLAWRSDLISSTLSNERHCGYTCCLCGRPVGINNKTWDLLVDENEGFPRHVFRMVKS